MFIEGDSDQTIIQKKIDEGFYKKIVISQESKGCLVFSGKEKIEIPVPRDVKPKDTVGGGDSLLTGISIGLISGYDMIQSTMIGCLSAFVTIQKPFQTGTVNPDEIMLSLKQIINQWNETIAFYSKINMRWMHEGWSKKYYVSNND